MKRAEMLTDNLVQIVLVAAGIALLLMLFWALLEPSFNKVDETAKVYFEDLDSQLKVAEEGSLGNFFMMDDQSDDEYYIVYFGKKGTHTEDGRHFVAFEEISEYLCICSWDDDEELGDCSECSWIQKKSLLNGEEKETWMIGQGKLVKIGYVNGKYEFRYDEE